MRHLHWILFVAVFSLAFAAVPAKKAPAKKTPAKTTSAKKTPAKKASVKKGAVAGKSKNKRGAALAANPRASTWRSHQAVPTPERYKEIQEALVSKGYLKSEANGVWDTQSADALRQFQTENKLSPTGKLSSASLIGLGLGPKNSPALPAPAAAAEPQSH